MFLYKHPLNDIVDSYYISKLVRTLWLVSLAGHTLLLGPLKFKVLFVAKLLHDLSPNFLNLCSKETFWTFFYSKLCTKALANESLKSNFKLTRFAFDLLQKFEAVPHEWKSFQNPSDTQWRYNKYLTNLIFSICTVSYGPMFFPLWFMARQ